MAIRSKCKTYFKIKPRRIGPSNLVVQTSFTENNLSIGIKYSLLRVIVRENLNMDSSDKILTPSSPGIPRASVSRSIRNFRSRETVIMSANASRTWSKADFRLGSERDSDHSRAI
jgi:hypothetical protein